MSQSGKLIVHETKRRLAFISAGVLSMGSFSHLAFAEDATLPAVTVNGATDKARLAKQVSAGALGDRADIDTPYSTKTVGHEEIEDREASSLAEVLKYDAATTATGSSGVGPHPTTLSIRGIRVDDLQGYKIDGLSNIKYGTEMPLEMFERVEVLKGLSGFMYGFAMPGGIVNFVTKRPTQASLLSFDIGYVGSSDYKEHVDAGGRFGGPDQQQFGYRVNLVHESGDLNVESGSIRRTSAGAAFDARITDDLTLNFDFISQERKTKGGTDITTSASYAIPAPISGTTRLYSNGAYNDANYNMATLGLVYRIYQNWSNEISYRYSDSVRDWKRDFYVIRDNSGDYTTQISAGRRNYNFNQWQDLLQGRFYTGPLQHQMVLGAMTQEFTSTQPASNPTTPSSVASTTPVTGNIYSPTISSAAGVNYSGANYKFDLTKQSAIFASDTVTFSPEWSILGGLRYTAYADHAHASPTAAEVKYTASPVNPTVALLFKPLADTTLYASYAQALQQGGIVGSQYANASASLAPFESKQTEVGVKTEQSHWNASAAIFRVEEALQYVSSSNVYVEDGETRNQGIELNAMVRATSRLSVEGSYMRLSSVVTDGPASQVGKRPVSGAATGAPDSQAAAQVIYLIPQINGLSLRAGVAHTGTIAVDPANIHILPSYTLYDAGFNYRTRIGQHTATLGLNVTNLADKKYWSYYQSNTLDVGAPRGVAMNLRIDL